MTDMILLCAKYFIIILFAYFTYLSFRAQRDVPDERKRTTYALQRILLLLIHAASFLCIGIHVSQEPDLGLTLGQTIGLYAGQLIYLVAMSFVVPRLVALSQGLNNVMCMFLAIGFVIQTRLNFEVTLRQFLIIIFGSGVFLVFVFLCKRAKFMRNLTWIYGAAGMALLAMVLVLSRVVKGAKLALDLGFLSFQPAEFVKILFVLFVAAAFYRSNTFKTVLMTGVCAMIHVLILVFCHDLGTALILFVIYVLMLYVATKKVLYLGAGAAVFVVASIVAYHIFSHVALRITAWMDPWSDIDGGGYQLAQGLFAVGTGGWFGSGLFGGKPESVPMASNDMVFSAIAEELGGIFAILLVLLCLCFVLMVFRVAIRVNNPFYKLLSFGLGSAYGFQVFLTIGGTISFIPLTGVNIPFISSGGSSLLASMVMIGMIQALYVISEADVEQEREKVAYGVPLDQPELSAMPEEFSDERMMPEEAPLQSRRIRRARPEEELSQTGRIRQVMPEEAPSQIERIRQVRPEEERFETRRLPKRPAEPPLSQTRRIRKIEKDDEQA